MPSSHSSGAAREGASSRRAPAFRGALTALLLGIYLLGLFHIAVLPPFEGFDETAHYSYLQQVALTGAWPLHGDPMSADVESYKRAGPTATSTNPPWTYRDFFNASPEIVAVGRQAIHGAPPGPAIWHAGTMANWEAQHPPLYYWLLAPAYRFASGWSLGAQLFWLRGLSYSLACIGLCLAAYAAHLSLEGEGQAPALFRLAPVLWPLLLPMWFPEMARLGNDSLVTLLTGCLCLLVGRAFREGDRRGTYLAIGLCLGLGLLTKATVFPLAVATIALLSIKAWTSAARPLRAGCLDLALCVSAILAVAGWWYVTQALRTGSFIGSNDAITLAQGGGLWEGLRHHGSLYAFLIMFGSFGLSLVVWTGTWSFMAPPFLAMLPLLLGALALVCAGLGFVATRRLTWLGWLGPLTLVLFILGLVYQSVKLIATIGFAAPAWYLHSFAPILWPSLAFCMAGALRFRFSNYFLAALLIYNAIFIVLAIVVEVLFYSGCGTKTGNYFNFSSIDRCLDQPSLIFDRLDVLAFPWAGVGLFVIGGSLLGIGCAIVIRGLLKVQIPVSIEAPALVKPL